MKEPQLDTIKVKGVTFQFVDSNPDGFVEMAPQPQPFPLNIEVAPNIYQSLDDYEANMKFDEARDEKLIDDLCHPQ